MAGRCPAGAPKIRTYTPNTHISIVGCGSGRTRVFGTAGPAHGRHLRRTARVGSTEPGRGSGRGLHATQAHPEPTLADLDATLSDLDAVLGNSGDEQARRWRRMWGGCRVHRGCCKVNNSYPLLIHRTARTKENSSRVPTIRLVGSRRRLLAARRRGRPARARRWCE